tara:strand:+ start:245 stop:463 length:219 start_codon:yes stop_codon:yes gene_type:complete
MSNKDVIKDLVSKLKHIENEMSLLRDDRKILLDDYRDKIDIKAFNAAWQIIKKRERVDEGALDNILSMMEEM